MYYKLDTDRMLLTALVDQETGPAMFRMREGRMYDMDPGEEAFSFSYQDSQDPPLLDYISGKCLMSKNLVETLEAAGVDNLQKFDAPMTDVRDGEINHGFCVVNVVGLVEAADMDSSDSLPLGSNVVFTKLAVDPEKAQGLIMFRLAESRSDLIVHERVARAIEAGDFRGVTLTPVSG
jgi:hypothetical protein